MTALVWDEKFKHKGVIDGFVWSKHPLYATWHNMMRRCYSPNNASFPGYGGRGVQVCARWHNLANFVADMPDKTNPKLTLERKDNSGDYSPDNCVWENRTNQCHNRRKFSNNTSGFTGVVEVEATGLVRYEARYDHERQRYTIGRFDTPDLAYRARTEFVKLFERDRGAALRSIEHPTVWCNSKTKVRGITPHVDGGYIVRCTIKGVRHYVGYFKDLDAATGARSSFLESGIGPAQARV